MVWDRLFWTGGSVHMVLDMWSLTCNLGHGVLDLRFWTGVFGHVILDMEFWTEGFGHVVLDIWCWTCSFGHMVDLYTFRIFNDKHIEIHSSPCSGHLFHSTRLSSINVLSLESPLGHMVWDM